jgi:hypothetical protein
MQATINKFTMYKGCFFEHYSAPHLISCPQQNVAVSSNHCQWGQFLLARFATIFKAAKSRGVILLKNCIEIGRLGKCMGLLSIWKPIRIHSIEYKLFPVFLILPEILWTQYKFGNLMFCKLTLFLGDKSQGRLIKLQVTSWNSYFKKLVQVKKVILLIS